MNNTPHLQLHFFYLDRMRELGMLGLLRNKDLPAGHTRRKGNDCAIMHR